MSVGIKTEFGNFHHVTDGLTNWLLFECPRCGEKHRLQDVQMKGRMPVVCLGYPQADFPHYFEMHPFIEAIGVQIALARFMGDPSPFIPLM